MDAAARVEWKQPGPLDMLPLVGVEWEKGRLFLCEVTVSATLVEDGSAEVRCGQSEGRTGLWQNAGAYGVLLLETDMILNHHRTLPHVAGRCDRQGARCSMSCLGRMAGPQRSLFAGRLPVL